MKFLLEWFVMSKKYWKKFGFTAAKIVVAIAMIGVVAYHGYTLYSQYVLENEILKKMIARLQADSRIADVIVTSVTYNPTVQQHMTTIKFLEYDAQGRPLQPRYFTFSDNIIQFQSLVIRFDDQFVLAGDKFKGQSAYLFWKAFVLDGAATEEYVIASVDEVPSGYKTDGARNDFEDELWQEFWEYALDADKATMYGIKNAQIEAPGMKFVPGMLYTLKIEHDGGIRIDVKPIPEILRGETL